MPRFKLTIEYAGTRYSGWQIQKNARTVQGELDRAVRTTTGRVDFELYGSGRTDSGVHALAQVAHLDVSTSIPAAQLIQRLNEELPADINVLRATVVPHRFHARHDAVARRYLYQVARRRTAFAKPFVWWVREPLDLARMREAAAAFVGMKDFQSFAAVDDDERVGRSARGPREHSESAPAAQVEIVRRSTRASGSPELSRGAKTPSDRAGGGAPARLHDGGAPRALEKAGTTGKLRAEKSTLVLVERLDVIEDGDLVLVGIEGSHFLWKMVRRVVGVLVEIGRGGLAPAAAGDFLRESSGAPARLTAPASGLFLDRVWYDGDPRDVPIRAATPLARGQ